MVKLGSTLRERAVADFVFEANISRYKDRLARETDPNTIATVRKLLSEEKAKLAEWRALKPEPKAAEYEALRKAEIILPLSS
jgi:hypothetical protein